MSDYQTNKRFIPVPETDPHLRKLLDATLPNPGQNEPSAPSQASEPAAGMEGGPQYKSKSGATRSERAKRYDLIPPIAIRRIAQRFTLGAEKHGAHNWRRGLSDAEFIAQAINHLEEHWLRFKESGNDYDDNLGAIAWGVCALMEVEAVNPELFNRVLYGKVEP